MSPELRQSGAEQSGFLTAYCDGGSRGNPGPAGFGVYLVGEDGHAAGELSEYLGKKTNNYAEYSALLAALAFALGRGYRRLRVVADSELMVKQIKGQYRVHSADLRPLYEEARRRIGRLERFQIEHVLRNKNKHADRLANEAMDRGMGKRSGRVVSGTSEHTPGCGPEANPGHAAARGASSGPGVSRESIPVVALDVAASAPQPRRLFPQGEIRGFVKNGVVHVVEGELPDGVFVRIVPE